MVSKPELQVLEQYLYNEARLIGFTLKGAIQTIRVVKPIAVNQTVG